LPWRSLKPILEIRRASVMIQDTPAAAAILDKGTFYRDFEDT
jgi:hypothetical protein